MPRRIPYAKPLGHQIKRAVPARQAEAKRERDRFYSGARWRRCREAFLNANPLCEDCLEEGRMTLATIAHHEEERLDNPERAYDHENLRALCGPHHTFRHKAKP